jgi:catenin alpha
VKLQVRILTDAVDDITTVDDFLAVTENHILEDVNECVAALQVNFWLKLFLQ